MRLLSFLAAASLLTVACAATNDDSGESSSQDLTDLKKHRTDAGVDSGTTGTTDGGGGDDGTPTRQQCTSSFGNQLLGANHGRLDGRLVAIVPAGQKSCSGDSGHDHLQIEMNGEIYDVAINVESIFFKQTNAPLVGGAWSEGWHAGSQLDYPSNLNLHSGDFKDLPQSQLAPMVEDALANANHLSIFATKYNDSGIHLVHRNGNGNDGAIIIDPLGPNPTYLVFHFSNQSF